MQILFTIIFNASFLGLRCETCSGSAECTYRVCDIDLDQCMITSYTEKQGDILKTSWIRGCTRRTYCGRHVNGTCISRDGRIRHGGHIIDCHVHCVDANENRMVMKSSGKLELLSPSLKSVHVEKVLDTFCAQAKD